MAAVGSEFVTLCLGAEVFAVPVGMVCEILDYRDCFRIPEGPSYLLGLIDVRGHGTPVINLRTKLGLAAVAPGPMTRIIVIEVPLAERTLALGIVADRVLEVVDFANAEIENAPDVGTSWRSDYIAGVVRRNGGFVVLFDLPKLLEADEPALLSSVA